MSDARTLVPINYEWRGEVANAEMDALHVDFEDHLRAFYFDTCGFTPTNGGLIEL